MIKFENHLGSIEISQDYFANLVGHAASECFGVAGMVESTASQGLRYILKKDEAQDKGVKVRYVGGGLVIDLHIAVTYGVNISAIVKSIGQQGSLYCGRSNWLPGSKSQCLC